MERFLEGRTALVTGSVQGIGMAIAKALASAGARIGVHGLAGKEESAEAVEAMLTVRPTRASSTPICAR
jgi:3-hydroxybutyrate dehydrogenase